MQPGQYSRHLDVVRWLIEQRKYQLAKKELTELLDETSLEEAQRLLNTVNAQLRLMESSKKKAANGAADDNEAKGSTADGDRTQTGPTRWLTREEVNLIRVYEIDFRNPPKLRVRPETIEKLIDQHSTDPRIPASRDGRKRLLRAEPTQVARLMFRLRAQNLYGEIEVLSEPPALDLFRRRIHDAWLVNTCATRRCHGGPAAGGFELHRRHFRDSRVAFANLLILERLNVDDRWPLINYEKPHMSLLIQHGLPRSDARLPHPDVRGWEPVFRSRNGRPYKAAMKWINSMMNPRPDYPIEFDPNPPEPATQPDSDSGESDREGRQTR